MQKNKEKTPELYITEAEAMQLTGYKRTSLYLLRKENEVKWTAAKTGRRVRYHKTDLQKFIGL